ncbi:MAG: protein kinase [Planctomycetes bacterium]|nr:protein kinase [Planctomycetota bacterium]
MNDAERWRRAEVVFATLLDTSPDARTRVLAEQCGDDAALAAEVTALLRGHALAGDDFLEPPGGEAPAETAVGTLVGGCRLLELLGEGGMGTVWRARDEALGRDVAVKVLHGGVLGRVGLQRFAQEAAALARLQHPAIATIFATGKAGDGALAPPFFVLELVAQALPITAFAERRGLARRDRVGLLVQVADAVQHAHQRAVVHRDLKPGNVLVGSDGVPKVIDFGIARLCDADGVHTTRAGQVLGTLAYLSPEQSLGDPDQVDVRTDVHALGLLGCELLTGRLPYSLDGLGLPAALQRIATEPPLLPQQLAPGLERDLAAVLAKAYAKEPAHRYASAGAFADDLRAFLAHRPVVARPVRPLGAFRLFVRRSPGLAAALALACVSLVGGTFFSVHFGLAAEERAVVAERERATAQQLADSLRDIVRAGNLAIAGREVTMREALDAAAATIERRFAGAPSVAFELRLVLGDAYRVLGRIDDAERQLGAASSLVAAMADPRLAQARVQSMLAPVRVLQRRPEAIDLLTAALAVYESEARGGAQAVETRARRGGVLVAFERFAEAEPDLATAIAALEPAGPSLALAEAQANLGTACFEQVRLPDAERHWRAALATFALVAPAEHPHRVKTLGNLVNVLRSHAPRDAVALAREVVQITSKRFPDGHTDVAQARAQLAFALLEVPDAAADAEFAAVVEMRERLQGAQHPATLSATTDLGYARLGLGRPAEAIAPLQRAWEVLVATRETPQAAAVAMLLGLARTRTGELAAGEELLRHAVVVRTQKLGADNPRTHIARSALGECLLARGAVAEAEPLLVAAETALAKAFGPEHRETRAARERVAALARARR